MARNAIESRLKALRGRLRRLIVAAGLARIALLLFGLIAGLFVLDWLFHLAPEWRLALSLAGAVGLLVAVYRYLVRPLLVPMPDDQLALLFERRFPELEDVLVSAVQLAIGRGSAPSDLIEAVVDDAERAADGLDPGSVSRARPVVRMSALAVGAVALSVLFALLSPATTRIFAARLLDPYGPARWPRRTELVLRVNDEADSRVTVVRGRQIEVRVDARNAQGSAVWRAPRTVAVAFEPVEGTAESRHMRRIDDHTYVAYYKEALGDLTITARAAGADDVSATVHVTIPPSVEQIWTWPRLPAYADDPEHADRAEPRPGELSFGASEIRALEGSTLTAMVRTNMPLDRGSATLVTDTGKSVEMTKTEPRPADGPTHHGSFVLEPDMRWFRVHLVHKSEEATQKDEQPRTVQLRVVEDKPPQVRMVRPGRETRCTRYAVLPIEVEVSDDRGLRRVWLSYERLDHPDEEHRVPLQEFPPEDRLNTELDLSHRWDLSELGLEEGDTLTYWCGAEDWRDAIPVEPGRKGQKATSDKHYVRIVSHADLAHELDQQLLSLRERLREARDRQQGTRDQADELLRRIDDEQPMTETERTIAADAENVQRELGRAVSRIADAVEQIRGRMEDNRIGSFADRRRLDDIRDELNEVAKSDMPRAADFVRDARRDLAGEDGKKNLETASSVQNQIIDRLQNVIAKMEHDDGIGALVRAARALLRQQRGIREHTEAFRQRPDVFGAAPDDLEPDSREALDSLVRNQQLARNSMRNLEQEMLDVFDSLKNHDARRAQLVEQAQELAADEQIRLMMEEAAETLRSNHVGRALSAQATAIAGLEALLDLLEDAQRTTGSDEVLNQILSDLRGAIEDIRKLHEEQTGHASDTEEISRDRAQGDQLRQAREKLKALRDRQQTTAGEAAETDRPQDLEDDQKAYKAEADDIAGELDEQAEKAEQQRAPQTEAIRDAAGKTQEAGEHMDRAAESMREGQSQDAQAAGTDAAGKLDEADAMLGKALEEIERKLGEDIRETAIKQDETQSRAETVEQRLRRLAEQNEKLSSEASQGLNQAGDQVGDARSSMQEAHSALEQQDTVTGEEKAREARDKLAEARRELEQMRDEFERQQQEQKLLDLIVEIQPMLEQQERINSEVERIDTATVDLGLSEPERPDRVRLSQLSNDQGNLADRAKQLQEKVSGENAPVFGWGFSKAYNDMTELKGRLAAFETDAYSQDLGEDIVNTLRMLVEALKQEHQRIREGHEMAGGGGGDDGGEPMLVPPSAQLKLLKARELEIHNATKRLFLQMQLRGIEQFSPLQRMRLRRLAEEQADLGELTEELADALEKEAERRREEMRGPE